jgi:fluoride exporter
MGPGFSREAAPARPTTPVMCTMEPFRSEPDDDPLRAEISARRLGPMTGRPQPRWLGGRARLEVVVAIALGGALGAPARYAISLAMPVATGAFPWATFWTNVSGSFLLGVLLTLIIERWPPTRFIRPFAAVGFLGSYTTWSTFMVEADQLIAHGHMAVAVAYAGASLAAGLTAVYGGIVVGRLWPGSERGLT